MSLIVWGYFSFSYKGVRKTSKLPLVSILIPAFNAEKWIADTIQSSLAQTWPQKEIIVVDDGSTDATLNIVRKFKSPLLKCIHQKNKGACNARNRALGESRGDYIQWLDADDLLAPDKIERQLAVAERVCDPEALFTSSWGRFYYRPSKAKFDPTPLWRDLEAVDWLILRLANPWMMLSSVWLVSRRLTEMAGPWDERLTLDDDGEYFCRLASLSSYITFVSESRCYYRMANPLSLSRSNSQKAWASQCLSIDLTINHVLAREDSERTRTACIKRLNMTVSTLATEAPEQANRLRQRVTELGGKLVPKSITRKYAIFQGIFGDRSARLVKEATWRVRQRICCLFSYLMAKLFDD